MKIALVDDEPDHFEEFQKIVKAVCHKRRIAAEIRYYSDPVFFWNDVCGAEESYFYDVCFLDIEMPRMNGIELSRKLRELHSFPFLVFLTAHAEFFRAGYEVNAFDYLDKGQMAGQLPHMMERLLDAWEEKMTRYYCIEMKYRLYRIAFEDILYIRKDGQYAIFVLKNQENASERISLQKVKAKLSAGFMPVGRGYLINIRHIESIGRRSVTLDDGTEISVGIRDIVSLKETVRTWWDELGKGTET